VKWAQWDKTQSRELLVCSYVCASHCAQLLHTILHRTDLIVFTSYPPDNHHCSDDVYLREGGKHAVLHMAPKWSSHRTTRAGPADPCLPIIIIIIIIHLFLYRHKVLTSEVAAEHVRSRQSLSIIVSQVKYLHNKAMLMLQIGFYPGISEIVRRATVRPH